MILANAYQNIEPMKNTSEAPQFLYKVISKENWDDSRNKSELILSAEDGAFIHLSTQDQLERILSKYWANVPEYVVLKLETKTLKGSLVLEANPGGTNRYWHLYDGSIPADSIVESKVVHRGG